MQSLNGDNLSLAETVDIQTCDQSIPKDPWKEMQSSASPPLPIPPYPIFIDTNLDTHLTMGIFWDDTVADLKRKVRIQHGLCFPDIGEITVRAIKVRREATVYNLSDLMLVRSAFNGINGAWFLIVDATPASVIQHQAGSSDCIVTVNNGLPRSHGQFQTSADEALHCNIPSTENTENREKNKKRRSSKLNNEVDPAVPSKAVDTNSPSKRGKTSAETSFADELLDLNVTEPATKSSHKKKKTKTKKEQNKIDAPRGVGEEKTLEEAVRKIDNDQRKESHAVILDEEIADDGNCIKQGSEDLSHTKGRRSNQRKKTELPDQQPKQFLTPITPDAQALEEHSLRDQDNGQVEAFKRAIPNETAASRSDSAPVVLKEKKPRGSKKKSSKVDLSNHEATVDEYVPSLGKDTAEVNDEGMLEATQNSLGKDSKMATVNGEAVSLETPAEVHGRRSRLQKKKSDKTTEETTTGSLLDAHDDFGKEAACDISHNADHGRIQDGSLKNTVEEALNKVPSEVDGEPLENDVVDFVKHFVPKVSQNESAEPQELAPMERQTRKPHTEKTTRKRKLSSHPKDSSNKVDDLMSNEHHLHQSKPEETNFALHDLADLAEQLPEKGRKSNKADNEKPKEDVGKTEVSHGNNSPKIGSPSKLHNKKIAKKLKEPRSGMVHDLLTRDEWNVHEEYPTGKLPFSGSNAKSLPYSESNDVAKLKTASTGIQSAPVNPVRSGLDSDISLKEGVVSAADDKNNKESDADGFNLSQSSNTARKRMPLSSILRRSSSYIKLIRKWSQSQLEDSKSQPVDMVLETQPD